MVFEPTTPPLARLCSTPELRPRSIAMAGFYSVSIWMVSAQCHRARLSTWQPP